MLRHGLKDAELAVAAARDAGLPGDVVRAAAAVMRRAAELAYGEDDTAAAFEAALICES